MAGKMSTQEALPSGLQTVLAQYTALGRLPIPMINEIQNALGYVLGDLCDVLEGENQQSTE